MRDGPEGIEHFGILAEACWAAPTGPSALASSLLLRHSYFLLSIGKCATAFHDHRIV